MSTLAKHGAPHYWTLEDVSQHLVETVFHVSSEFVIFNGMPRSLHGEIREKLLDGSINANGLNEEHQRVSIPPFVWLDYNPIDFIGGGIAVPNRQFVDHCGTTHKPRRWFDIHVPVKEVFQAWSRRDLDIVRYSLEESGSLIDHYQRASFAYYEDALLGVVYDCAPQHWLLEDRSKLLWKRYDVGSKFKNPVPDNNTIIGKAEVHSNHQPMTKAEVIDFLQELRIQQGSVPSLNASWIRLRDRCGFSRDALRALHKELFGNQKQGPRGT